MKLPLTFVSLALAAGASSYADNSHGDGAGDAVEQLQKIEVTGEPTMGINAGIACDHMLFGKVVQVVVNQVTKDGRGWKLGIRVGDEILAIDGDRLIGTRRSDVAALMERVSQVRVGSIDLRRKGVAEPLHLTWELISPERK
jgi:C-terminal processing protease CtpA/Prc